MTDLQWDCTQFHVKVEGISLNWSQPYYTGDSIELHVIACNAIRLNAIEWISFKSLICIWMIYGNPCIILKENHSMVVNSTSNKEFKVFAYVEPLQQRCV